MKRAGILTFQNSNNHGALLQAFASQETLKKLGYDAEIINYVSPSMPSGQKLSGPFKAFQQEYLNVSEYKSREDLSRSGYDTILIGSDQVWNVGITGTDTTYFLPELAGKDVRVLPYAASFGMTGKEILANGGYYGPLLRNLDKISIREASNLEAVRQLAAPSSDIRVHVDPSLLLTAEEYRDKLSLADLPITRQYGSDYILFFSYYSDPYLLDFVNLLSRITGRKLVASSNFPVNKFVKGTAFADNLTPAEWLALIDRAGLVITDSFHGLMFSLIFRKAFYIYTCDNPGVVRLMDVLRKYGLTDRRLAALPDMEAVRYEVPYSTFEEVWQKEVQESLAYLQNS